MDSWHQRWRQSEQSLLNSSRSRLRPSIQVCRNKRPVLFKLQGVSKQICDTTWPMENTGMSGGEQGELKYIVSGILGKMTFRWRWLYYNWQLAAFTSCRTKHQLSRQSQNFHIPWTLTEVQKHSRALAFTRQLYALLTVKSKSCFPAPTMNSIVTFWGLIYNQTELFHALTWSFWGS